MSRLRTSERPPGRRPLPGRADAQTVAGRSQDSTHGGHDIPEAVMLAERHRPDSEPRPVGCPEKEVTL